MTNQKVTVKEFTTGSKSLPAPIYLEDPYVVLSVKGPEIVLASGDADYIHSLSDRFCGYYDDCTVDIRRHDLHLHDNTRFTEPPASSRNFDPHLATY